MPGSVSHAKKHGIGSTKDHRPVVGAVENHVVVFDANGLPVRDSTIAIASLLGGLIPQGGWDADLNIPAIVSGVGTPGYFWYVTVPGATLIDGINDWDIGDIIFYDGTSSTYKKIDNTDRVWEVDGREGTVNLNMSYITKAETIGNTPPAGYEGMKCLTTQGSGGLWAGHDWVVASYDKGVWTYRTPTVGEVFLVLTCPVYNSPPLDYQVPNLFVFKNSRFEEFVPASIREAPFVTGTVPIHNIKNFSGQAVSLYVSDIRGNDTYGDGSLFNPFKTIQKAVDYADLNYSGTTFSIILNEDFALIPPTTVVIPSGMTVSLVCQTNYVVYIDLTVSQFCSVYTDGVWINNLTEVDSGDTKSVVMQNGGLNTIIPALIPSIYIEFGGTYCVIPYATLITQVLGLFGYYQTNGVGGNTVLAQIDEPIQDVDVVNLGHLKTSYEGKVKVRVSDSPSGYLNGKLDVQPSGYRGIKKEIITLGSQETLFVHSYQETLKQANYTVGGLAFSYGLNYFVAPGTPPNIQVAVEDLGVVANLYGFQTRFVHTLDGSLNWIGCVVHVSKMYRVGANVFIAECATNDCRVHIRASAEAL